MAENYEVKAVVKGVVRPGTKAYKYLINYLKRGLVKVS